MSQLKSLHSRRFLLIYLAVVIMLLVLLTQQYATDDGPAATQPASKTFKPAASLPQLLLKTDTGVRSNVHFEEQWTYFVFIDPDCVEHCDAPLRVLSAVNAALGPSAPAVFLLTTNTAHCPLGNAGMVCGVFNEKQQKSLLKAAELDPSHVDASSYSNMILLVNPQAALQRRYQLPIDSAGLIKDFIAQRREFAISDASVQRR